MPLLNAAIPISAWMAKVGCTTQYPRRALLVYGEVRAGAPEGDYVEVPKAIAGIGGYFGFYNHERPQQPLGYLTAAEVLNRGGGLILN